MGAGVRDSASDPDRAERCRVFHCGDLHTKSRNRPLGEAVRQPARFEAMTPEVRTASGAKAQEGPRQ